MDSTSFRDIRSEISLILQDFTQADQLFGQWRSSRMGKKAVGQEEFVTSLSEGKEAVKCRWEALSQKHGPRCYTGDDQVLASLVRIKATFAQNVIQPINPSISNTSDKSNILPIRLRVAAEEAKKETISALEDFSLRLSYNTLNMYKTPDPGDVLPHMPLPPHASQTSLVSSNGSTLYPNSSTTSFGPQAQYQDRVPRPYRANNSSQSSFADRIQQHNLSQSSFNSTRPRPYPQNVGPNLPPKPAAYQPPPRIQEPSLGRPLPLSYARTTPAISDISYEDDKDIDPSSTYPDSSTSLTFRSLTHRASQLFQKPYHNITPHKASEPVTPTWTPTDCAPDDEVAKGSDYVDKLWERANGRNGRLKVRNESLRERSKSAPLAQGPWPGNIPTIEEEGEVPTRWDGGGSAMSSLNNTVPYGEVLKKKPSRASVLVNTSSLNSESVLSKKPSMMGSVHMSNLEGTSREKPLRLGDVGPSNSYGVLRRKSSMIVGKSGLPSPTEATPAQSTLPQGRRLKSEPSITFSNPMPKFRRDFTR